MSVKLEKRYCGAADLDAFAAFFARHWGAEHILARDREFACWQMSPARSTLFGDAALAGIGYWDGDALVGFIGAMPMDFNIDGRVVDGMWLCNLLAAPDYLDHGIGVKLMTAVHSVPAAVIGAVGINLRVIPMYRALRYLTGDRVPRHLRVLDTERFATLVDGEHWRRLVDESNLAPASAALRVGDVATMDSDWNGFWQDFSARGYLGTHRDAAFYDWRYARHPRLRYQLAVARDAKGKVVGGAVWREEQVRDSDIRVLRLIELLGSDDTACRALLQHVERWGRRRGAVMIDHYSSQAPAAALRDCGWFLESAATGDVLPCLFQPLVRQSRDMNYAVRVMARAGTVAADAAARLLIVKSDGDQDRPN